MRIILASNSPRRRELMKLLVRDFDTVSTDVDEKGITDSMISSGVPPRILRVRLQRQRQRLHTVKQDHPKTRW